MVSRRSIMPPLIYPFYSLVRRFPFSFCIFCFLLLEKYCYKHLYGCLLCMCAEFLWGIDPQIDFQGWRMFTSTLCIPNCFPTYCVNLHSHQPVALQLAQYFVIPVFGFSSKFYKPCWVWPRMTPSLPPWHLWLPAASLGSPLPLSLASFLPCPFSIAVSFFSFVFSLLLSLSYS